MVVRLCRHLPGQASSLQCLGGPNRNQRRSICPANDGRGASVVLQSEPSGAQRWHAPHFIRSNRVGCARKACLPAQRRAAILVPAAEDAAIIDTSRQVIVWTKDVEVSCDHVRIVNLTVCSGSKRQAL